MNRTWIRLFSISVALTLSLAFAAPPSVWAAGDQKETKKQTDEAPEDAVRQVLLELGKAVNGGDPSKIAAYFSDDVVFIDETGEEAHGKVALEQRFIAAFSGRGAAGQEARLHPEKISFPSHSVAIVIGSVSRKNDFSDLPAARFSMTMVKQNNAWLIDQAQETAIKEIGAAEHLQELSWMVGNWRVDQQGSAPNLDVTWGNNQNFILSKCTFSRNGAKQVDSQIIGWDPRCKSIVSWHFNADGGFGYGMWSRDSGRWIVTLAGVGADGSITRATNVFSVSNPDEFTWQSTEQAADGVAIADTSTLKVKKVKPQ